MKGLPSPNASGCQRTVARREGRMQGQEQEALEECGEQQGQRCLASTLSVTVLALSGDVAAELEVAIGSSARGVKLQLADLLGYPFDLLRLLCNASELLDTHTFAVPEEEVSQTLVLVIVFQLPQEVCTRPHALVDAAWHSQHGLVRALLQSVESSQEREALLLQQNPIRYTALHAAAAEGHETVLAVLLHESEVMGKGMVGQALMARDESHRTALHVAASAGHANEKVLSPLLACTAGAALRQLLLAEDVDARTALHCAACIGHEQAFTPLLAAAVAADFGTGSGLDTLELLLLATDGTSRTALHWAALNARGLAPLLEAATKGAAAGGFLEHLLLAHDRNSRTALHMAADSGREEALVPLLAAAEETGGEALTRLLLAKDRSSRTALHVAVAKGREEAQRLLLAAAETAGEATLEAVQAGLPTAGRLPLRRNLS